MLLSAGVTVFASSLGPGLLAQEAPDVPAPLPTGAPLADPVVDAPAELRAGRATAWQEGATRVLLLEDAVTFRVGSYGFRADRAVIRVDQERLPGQTVTHLAAYLDNARPLFGTGRVSAEATRLLVTASTRGDVQLQADAFQPVASSPADQLVRDAAARIARYRAGVNRETLAGPTEPLFPAGVDDVREARRAAIAQQQLADAVDRLPTAAPRRRPADAPDGAPTTPPPEGTTFEPTTEAAAPSTVLPTEGSVYVSADRVVGSTQDNNLMLVGNASVVYQGHGNNPLNLALKAEKVVVFLMPSEDSDAAVAGPAELQATNIQGVYLEDNVVITDGSFTVRAPRMYFDLEQNKAVLLDAVMYTYDVTRNVPLYMRADMVKQTSATSFEAKNALLTTSEFAEPHFAIAADTVTLERNTAGAGAEAVESFTAKSNVVKWGALPVFWWPYLAGQNRDIPLRELTVGVNSDTGLEVQTMWDVFALAGQTRPEGVDALARVDYLGDHGPALGAIVEYERPDYFGEFNGYWLLHDNGEDELANRNDVEHDGDMRGIAHWQHRHELQNSLELTLETSYVSDETLLEEFFEDRLFESREYETSAQLKQQEDDWAWTLLAKYNINDFTPLLTTLQTPGYTVDKLPEASYYRVGTSLWDDRLTYFSESRAGMVRIRPGEDSPSDRGFTDAQSLALFGIPAATDFEDGFDAAGYPLDWVGRFDTRHELNLPLEAGIFDVTPYVTGRFTGYDDDFEELTGEEEQIRLWGQVGTRIGTEFVNSWNNVESRILDVHRLRHVIEPSVDVFAMASTHEENELPVFDQDVENIDDGAGVQFGLVNTLQTQRGGPGRWRNVDWIRLETDLVLRENDDDPFATDEGELPRFFDYRPEFASGGDHFYTELLWAVSDTFGVTGELTHSFETDDVVQWRLGASMQHSSDFATFADYEEIEPLDLRMFRYGFSYQLTTKYRFAMSHTLDFGGTGARELSAALERRLPRWRLSVVGGWDEADDETTVGIVLMPEGFDVGAPRIPLDRFLGAGGGDD